MPSAAAPNTGNYSVLKAVVKYSSDGGTTFRHLGNCKQAKVAFKVTFLDHYSEMTGTRVRDKRVPKDKTGELVLILDEWDPKNVAMNVMGSYAPGSSGAPGTIEILSLAEVKGWVRIIGVNEVGVKMQWDFPNTEFEPTGDLQLISDEWAEMEMTAAILYVPEWNNFGKIHTDITDEVSVTLE
jgi:hypothetical protein